MKVTGPMFSLDASGSIGGVLVASKWKGRNYFRALVKPSNPKSALQISTRAMFAFLSKEWAGLTSAEQASWQTIADQIVASPFNAYMKQNQTNWRNFLTPSQDVVIDRSAAAETVAGFTATAGVRQITIAVETDGVIGDDWGFILFRGLTTGFTPAISNVHAVFASNGTTSVTFIDTPLDPDEYFYVARIFNDVGGVTALSAEVSATVA